MLKQFFLSATGKSIVVLLVVCAFLFFLFYFKKDKNIFSTKALTFSAVLIAIGIAVSQIKLFALPQGGSVTLFSMFFISYIGYMFGLRVGIVAGITFGLLKLIIKPDVYYPLQLVFDYIFAFGALGLSGFFVCKKNTLRTAYIISAFGRFVFAVFSGYVFFGSYAPKGWNPFIYSLWYNFSYIGPEAVITLIILSIPVIGGLFERLKNMNYLNANN